MDWNEMIRKFRGLWVAGPSVSVINSVCYNAECCSIGALSALLLLRTHSALTPW